MNDFDLLLKILKNIEYYEAPDYNKIGNVRLDDKVIKIPYSSDTNYDNYDEEVIIEIENYVKDVQRLFDKQRINRIAYFRNGDLIELHPVKLLNVLIPNKGRIILPKEIKLFSKIENLDLTSGTLSTLPQWLAEMTSIKNLFLSFNKFEIIPELILKLENLDVLSVNGNNLSNIPDWMSQTKIHFLDLSNNKLRELPQVAADMENLSFSRHHLEGNFISPDDLDHFFSLPVDQWREYIRGKTRSKIFLSHAVTDFKEYEVKKLASFLDSHEEIGKTYYCEEDLSGNIDQFMNETLPQCQYMIFLATEASLQSNDCQHEIDIAIQQAIPIIVVKDKMINWNQIEKLGIKRKTGVEITSKNIQKNYEKINNLLKNISDQERRVETDKLEYILDKLFRSKKYDKYISVKQDIIEQLISTYHQKNITTKEFIAQLGLIIEDIKSNVLNENQCYSCSYKNPNIDYICADCGKKTKHFFRYENKTPTFEDIEDSVEDKINLIDFLKKTNIYPLRKKSTAEFGYATPALFYNNTLFKLDLSGLDLTRIDPSIGNLKNLESLILTSNELTAIPETIKNLTRLKTLKLQYSFGPDKLTEIPYFLYYLKDLKDIDLSIGDIANSMSYHEDYKTTEWYDAVINNNILAFLRQKINSSLNICLSFSKFEKNIETIRNIAHNLENWIVIYPKNEEEFNDKDSVDSNISKSHIILLFITTDSLKSENSLQIVRLAKQQKTPIIPIKHIGLGWEELQEFDLDRELGIEYNPDDFDSFISELIIYIEKFVKNVDVYDKEQVNIDRIKIITETIIDQFIRSEELSTKSDQIQDLINQYENQPNRNEIRGKSDYIDESDFFVMFSKILTS